MEAKIKEVRESYAWIRYNNHTIPDDVLDLMKDAAIEKLSKKNEVKTGSFIILPSDADITTAADNRTINIAEKITQKVNLTGKVTGVGEVYLLKIGFEVGAKWMRDKLK